MSSHQGVYHHHPFYSAGMVLLAILNVHFLVLSDIAGGSSRCMTQLLWLTDLACNHQQSWMADHNYKQQSWVVSETCKQFTRSSVNNNLTMLTYTSEQLKNINKNTRKNFCLTNIPVSVRSWIIALGIRKQPGPYRRSRGERCMIYKNLLYYAK